MKKLVGLISLVFASFTSFSQTPQIGHFQQLSTVRRGDTLDVAWYFIAASGVDIRSFQVDWQYKKRLFSHIETTVDVALNGRSPEISYKSWENYKYSSYSNGSYSYNADTSWTIGRNYLVLPAGSAVSSNGYVIHNKYKINAVIPNFESDSVYVNWARMFRVDGTSIGDNVATLNYSAMRVKLLGNLTISGKLWLPASAVARNWTPIIYCYDNVTGTLISQTVPNPSTGDYTLDNIDENKRYKIQVKFTQDSLIAMRDNAVTISDAVKSFNEFTFTDVNQQFGRQYLKHGLSYLIGDLNFNQKLDGGDPYSIYASVSGLRPIDTTKLIGVFKKDEYDSLVLGANQWSDWVNFSNRGNFVTDTVGTTNLVLDLKYFILGDVDRSHSSPVFDAGGNQVTAAVFFGDLNINIPNSYAVNQPMYVPFNVSTNGITNTGLQFEMKYDVTKVKFEEIISNIQGPWLQYVTHDESNGIIRFGGMNNQTKGGLLGQTIPFKLKFSARNPGEDISSFVFVRKLMDASHANGDHFNIVLASDRILLSYRANGIVPVFQNVEPTAVIRPNPTSGIFELVVTLPQNTLMNISIFDYAGKKVMDLGNIKSDDIITSIVKRVNASSLAQGMYLLRMSNESKVITKPFLKS
jgi:hypothetical protein